VNFAGIDYYRLGGYHDNTKPIDIKRNGNPFDYQEILPDLNLQ